MSIQNKIPLKTFWDTVEERLAAYSIEDLRAILRAMAQATGSNDRQLFLAQLKVPEAEATPVIQEQALLADIDDLIAEFEEVQENADAWEEERWDEDYYDDEDGLGPYEDFIESLTALFDQAEAAFDYGDLDLAREAYQRLFSIIGQEDDYGRGVQVYNLNQVDWEEAVARYLRAIYETTPLTERVQILHTKLQYTPRRQFGGKHPMFNDLIMITPRPLPELEQFLPKWGAYLRTQDAPSGSDNDAWLREAVALDQGIQGLEALARAEGQHRPRAYLDWFAALADENRQQDILDAAQQALHDLPATMPIRAAIADYVYDAAKSLKQPEAMRLGRWEAFAAKPTLIRLLDLWDIASDTQERATLMQQALKHIKAQMPSASTGASSMSWGGDALEHPAHIGNNTLAHAYLLTGEWTAAQKLATDANVLGWSNATSYQGLIVEAFLVMLANAPSTLPANLTQVWELGLVHTTDHWSLPGLGNDNIITRLKSIYAAHFAQVHWPVAQQTQVMAWCLDIVQKRVAAIVGNQYRKSYNKAAVLVVACAETLHFRDEHAAARAFVDEVRGRFPRHSAFQREMKSALHDMTRSLNVTGQT